MNRRSLAALSIAGMSGVMLTAAEAQETPPMQHILSLTGHGEVKARPDLAIVTVGVVSQGTTAREALSANNAAMEKLLAALKAAPIEDRDIQTSNFSVNPRYNYGENNAQPPSITGYDVSNSVTVSVRNLEKLGGVLDTVVSEGSNQINGVMFTIAEPQSLEDDARKQAVADALRKAKLYAQAAGVTLGAIVAISEGGGYRPPVPAYAKAMRSDAAPAVPMAEGEQTVAIDAQLSWELK
ncbi:SIMPL domain-containing protein [soil metagenome]